MYVADARAWAKRASCRGMECAEDVLAALLAPLCVVVASVYCRICKELDYSIFVVGQTCVGRSSEEGFTGLRGGAVIANGCKRSRGSTRQ